MCLMRKNPACQRARPQCMQCMCSYCLCQAGSQPLWLDGQPSESAFPPCLGGLGSVQGRGCCHPPAPHWTHALTGALTLKMEDVEAARRGFQPASAWGAAAPAQAPGAPQGWQDVGGLADVIAALREALELPLRHPELIKLCAPDPHATCLPCSTALAPG